MFPLFIVITWYMYALGLSAGTAVAMWRDGQFRPSFWSGTELSHFSSHFLPSECYAAASLKRYALKINTWTCAYKLHRNAFGRLDTLGPHIPDKGPIFKWNEGEGGREGTREEGRGGMMKTRERGVLSIPDSESFRVPTGCQTVGLPRAVRDRA